MTNPYQCKADDCREPAAIGGYCRRHYDRLRRHGTTHDILRGILCPQCHLPAPCRRSSARFCSARCRKAWHQQHPGVTPPPARFILAEVRYAPGRKPEFIRQWRTMGPDDTPVPEGVDW